MSYSHHLSKTIDEGVNLSKNSILDKFIQASCLFGIVYAGITLWRDASVAMISTNSIVNIATTLVIAVLWMKREQLSYDLKAAILFTSFLMMGIKSIYLFGTYSNSVIIFLCFCSIILTISMSLTWSLLMMLLLSLIIPIRGYLHLQGFYPLPVGWTQFMADNTLSWVQLYITFILTAAILTIGVGQLRLEGNKYITLLKRTIQDLESTNIQLQGEISLKTAYQESLSLSSRKFETLFQGSRDGVVLINNAGRVVEANAAFCEMTGYSLEDLRDARSITDVMDTSNRELIMERFHQQMKGESLPMLMDSQLISRNGKVVPIEINSNAILAEDEVMLMSTLRDVSLRKQLENEKLNAALEAEERERERFSKDLHDDLGPVFSTLNLYLQTLSQKESDKSKQKVLNDLSEIVDSAVKQVRGISHDLSPYLLRDAGLIEAVRKHLRRFDDSGAIKATLETQSNEKIRFRTNAEIALYRVFLELLNNTIKHSGASEVKIRISWSSTDLVFDYIDNGKGFDPNRQVEKGGIGLKNIDSRVRAMEGTVNYSHVGNEMTIQIKIPL